MLEVNFYKKDTMHSKKATHESRNLMQARPYGQYVDLPHYRARYSLTEFVGYYISLDCKCQEKKWNKWTGVQVKDGSFTFLSIVIINIL